MRRVTAFALAILLSATTALAANSWAKTAAKVSPSVQRMTMVVTDQITGSRDEGSCTAFSINDLRDYFLTAAHCYGEDMTVGEHPARLVLYDATADLMILVVPESGEVPELRPAKVNGKECREQNGSTSMRTICTGDDVAGLGYGFGAYVALLKTGTVAYPDVIIKDWFGPNEHQLIVGFSWIHGMSGGPVFNTEGKVVGIIQWGDKADLIGGGRTLQEIMEKTAKYWGVNDNKKTQPIEELVTHEGIHNRDCSGDSGCSLR